MAGGKMEKLVLIVTVALTVGQLDAAVTKKYDKFIEQTIIQIEPSEFLPSTTGDSGMPPKLHLISSFHGTMPGNVKFVRFGFASISKDWRYLECGEIHILADGKHIDIANPGNLDPLEISMGKIGLSQHDGKAHVGWVLEDVYTMISMTTFKNIARAKKIEAEICNTEIEVSPQEMEEIRTFYSMLSPKRNEIKSSQLIQRATDKPSSSKNK